MIAATRLRQGPSNSARGAAAFVAETIRAARACGASGLLVLRADSAFYGADVINACRALGARFSITMRMNASVGFAHAPSGHFQANAAWLALAALAHNLTRAAGALASAFHARATTAIIRDRLINVPARLARSARCLTLHLPERWPWSEDPAVQHGACTAGPLTLPDRPARKGPRPVDRVEELGRPAATPCPNPQLSPNTACTTPKRSTGNQAGGSGLNNPELLTRTRSTGPIHLIVLAVVSRSRDRQGEA